MNNFVSIAALLFVLKMQLTKLHELDLQQTHEFYMPDDIELD